MGQLLHQQQVSELNAAAAEAIDSTKSSDSFIASCKEAAVWLVLATSPESHAPQPVGDEDEPAGELEVGVPILG